MPPVTYMTLFNPLSGKRPLYVYNEPHNLQERGTQKGLAHRELESNTGGGAGPAPSMDVHPALQRPRQRGRQGTLNHLCFSDRYNHGRKHLRDTQHRPDSSRPFADMRPLTLHSPREGGGAGGGVRNCTHFTGQETEVPEVSRVPHTGAHTDSS